MNPAPTSPLDAILSHVAATADADEAIAGAVDAAAEFGIALPDAMTGEFLEFLAARVGGSAQLTGVTPTAIVMTPAAAVVGVHLFRGFGSAARAAAASTGELREQAPTSGHRAAASGSAHAGAAGGGHSAADGHVTCIEPEIQFQHLARRAFADAGVAANAFRFLPSSPLDVVGRLAGDSYDLAVAECDPQELFALVKATLPALRPGGVLVLLDSLVDGAIAAPDAHDHVASAAREADREILALGSVAVSRLPLGAGMTVVTKTA